MAASVAASVAAVQAETEVSDCLASVVSGQWTMDSGQWTARPDSKAGQQGRTAGTGHANSGHSWLRGRLVLTKAP